MNKIEKAIDEFIEGKEKMPTKKQFKQFVTKELDEDIYNEAINKIERSRHHCTKVKKTVFKNENIDILVSSAMTYAKRKLKKDDK